MNVRRTENAGKKQLENLLKNVGNKVVKVGWFKDNRYDNGTPVAYVAAINEFGSPKNNIPSRPFIRQTIAEYEPTWKKIAEKGAKAIVKGTMSEEQVLQLLGSKVAGQIKHTISHGSFEAIKEATALKRLKRYKKKEVTASLFKPLIDTSVMITTVHAVVEES